MLFNKFTAKERDEETGLYYYGARYLDPRTSRWLSPDPALGDYIPSAPVNEEARKANGNLPGMGGVYNTVNMHLYHYAGNNPVKYVDPDGRQQEYFLTLNDMWNIVSQFDTGVKLANLFFAAGNGNKSAQNMLGYIFHEAGREVLNQINDKSGVVTLAFLAIGCPEGAVVSGAVGTIASVLLTVDDIISGNYKDAAIQGTAIVAGYFGGKVVGKIAGRVADSIKISVGKNGLFYSVGRRGALKTADALQKQLMKDIAGGKLGQDIAPELASQIIDKSIKAFYELEKEN